MKCAVCDFRVLVGLPGRLPMTELQRKWFLNMIEEKNVHQTQQRIQLRGLNLYVHQAPHRYFFNNCVFSSALPFCNAAAFLGPMKGGLSVGCRLKIFHNVWRRLGKESVVCRADWSVECRASNSECRCRPTLNLGWMSVSDGKNGLVSGVGNTPFMGPISYGTQK